jgi:hypothetical protein
VTQVTPRRLVFDATSTVDAPTVGGEGYPPGFSPVDLPVDADLDSTSPVDGHHIMDNDDSFKRRLDNFTKKVVRKRDSPLIRQLPKQPPAKAVLPWRSKRLVAQSLSRVPVSKRGEVLIMQLMGYTKSPSAPFTSKLETFYRIFDGNLTVSNAEALDALFADSRKGSSK